MNEINKRDLDKVFFSFSILSQDVFFNFGNDYIKKRTIYTIIGCNINGVRKYITSIFDDEYTKSSDWYNLLLSFKKRGLEYIFYVSMPNNQIIKNTFNLAFPNISYFYSCSSIMNKLSHYMSCSYSNNIFNHLKHIYLSNDINEFNFRKNELFLLYQDSPFIIDILNKEFNYFSSFLDYPLFLRKHIISFYFIRDFNKTLNVISHSQTSFSNISEFEEKLITTIKSFELKMYSSKKEWNSIISYLYKDYKELLLCVL
ncbi:MAG: transposase [Bacilli bacterium]